MAAETAQEETPAPVTVAKGGRGSSGADMENSNYPSCDIGKTNYENFYVAGLQLGLELITCLFRGKEIGQCTAGRLERSLQTKRIKNSPSHFGPRVSNVQQLVGQIQATVKVKLKRFAQDVFVGATYGN